METRKPDWTPPGQGLSETARRILAGEQASEETMGVLEMLAYNEIAIVCGGGGGGGNATHYGGGGGGNATHYGGDGGAGVTIVGYGGGGSGSIGGSSGGALGTVACQYCGRFGAYLSSCQGCGAQVRPRATR